MADASLVVTCLVAVAALVSIGFGQFSANTGKDYLPKRIRRLLRRVPASEEDHRTRGMSLMLRGASLMMVVLAIAAGPLIGNYNSPRFSRNAMFFITTVGLLAALYCGVWSYTLYQRVRFVSTRTLTDSQPELPQA